MKKIIITFALGVLFLFADNIITVTGSKTITECRKTASQKDFRVSFWAEGCNLPTWQAHYDWLIAKPDHFPTLPTCTPPTLPLPAPFPSSPGEKLDTNISNGYVLIDENITEVKQGTYPAYDGFDTVYTNFQELHGYCRSMSEAAWWKADVYQGIIETEYFTRTYRKICDQNNTDFPDLEENQTITLEWSDPEDRSSECTDERENIQEAVQDCNSTYRCVFTCNEPDTKFPDLAANEVVIDAWSEPEDKSVQCTDANGTVQEAKTSCKSKYQCVKKTDSCPTIPDEQVSSYVSPNDGTFHEDIEVSGATFGLHYSSGNLDIDHSTTIAYGWSLSSHATLKEGRLYLGNGSLYVVDTSNKEENLTIITSGSSELLFDENGKHIQTRDLYTKQTETAFSYDNLGQLARITDKFGQTTTIQRDSNGNATSITAAHGQVTYINIDSNSDLLEIQYEDTTSYTFEYEDHLMTLEREPNGNEFIHIFDEQGKVVKVIDAQQGEWFFGNTTESTLSNTQVTRASGDVTTYKKYFLENGLLKTEKLLPSGDIVLYENALDDSTQSTTTCGMKSTSVYKKADGTLYKDPFTGKRVLESSTVTTPSGLTKVSSYDKLYKYKSDGELKRIDATNTLNGKTSTNRKNFKYHREVNISPEGKKSRVIYDEKMQNPLIVNPYGLAKTTYTYDTQGRVTQETTGNRITLYTYDSRGNLETATTPTGQSTSYSYDARDRLSSITYPDGYASHYAYDANGNMTLLTTPTPTDHTFAYNGVNKRTRYTSPLLSATTYTYDKQRRVTKITKPSGAAIDYTYTNGRVTAVTTAEGVTNYSYYCQNNPSSISKENENFSFTYDGTLLTSMVQSGTLNETLSYTYNNDFLPSSLTYAGVTTYYLYNQDNELIQSGDFSIVRTEKNRISTITDNNYTQITTYNRYGELKKQNSALFTVKLRRNKNGQIKRKTETLNGQEVKYKYKYDDRDRLTEVKRNRKVVESYTYDSNGNRLTATSTLRGITNQIQSYNADDQISLIGQLEQMYDVDGYLTQKVLPNGDTYNFTYGTMGELKEVQTPTQTITYKHNANNQRVSKEVNGTTVEKYLWLNLTTLLAVYDKNDNLVQRFEYAEGRMPVAMTMNTQKYYLHYDQVGSLRAISDANKNIVKEIVYDTYGNIISDTNESLSVPFGFAGGLYAADTKLTRFGYRDYDAYTGKWTAKDPIGFDGGDSNLYGYVLGDPVRGFDPMGLYKHYGNWCGPNWTGGYEKPWDQLSPYEQSHTIPPIGPLDSCCKKHDKCHAKCRQDNKCDDDIKECQRRCDQKLCRCSLRTKDNKYGIPQFMCISGGI